MNLSLLAVGLSLFLFGLYLLSLRLEILAGQPLERRLTGEDCGCGRAFWCGAGLSAAIQSAGKVTGLLVGLTRSEVICPRKGEYAMLGTSLGGVGSVWVLALTTLPGASGETEILYPGFFWALLSLAGLLLLFRRKKPAYEYGMLILGFCVLCFGMRLLTEAALPLGRQPDVQTLLLVFENPLLGLLAGAAVTALLPSTVAAVGILQAFSLAGLCTGTEAVPLLLGFSLGICAPVLLSTAGTGKPARQAAVFYGVTALLQTGIGLCLYAAVRAMFSLESLVGPVELALLYSVLAGVPAAAAFPLVGKLDQGTGQMVPETGRTEAHTLLDERLFHTPSAALAACEALTVKMALLAKKSVLEAMGLLGGYRQSGADAVVLAEDELDLYEDELGGYLLQLVGQELSVPNSRRVSALLRMVGDFERIGDHAVNLMESAQTLRDRGGGFSEEGQREVSVLLEALTEIITISVQAFEQEDAQLARQVEPLEQVVDGLVFALKRNHTQRLQNGTCNIGVSSVLTDLLTDLERVSDHCSNIAVAVIEMQRCGFAYHDYLNTVKFSGDEAYEAAFHAYEQKYQIPA